MFSRNKNTEAPQGQDIQPVTAAATAATAPAIEATQTTLEAPAVIEAPAEQIKEENRVTTKPANGREVNYKIIRTLIENKFLFLSTGMKVEDGALKETVSFTMSSTSGRGKPAKVITVNYCPITGADLSQVDLSKLR